MFPLGDSLHGQRRKKDSFEYKIYVRCWLTSVKLCFCFILGISLMMIFPSITSGMLTLCAVLQPMEQEEAMCNAKHFSKKWWMKQLVSHFTVFYTILPLTNLGTNVALLGSRPIVTFELFECEKLKSKLPDRSSPFACILVFYSIYRRYRVIEATSKNI